MNHETSNYPNISTEKLTRAKNYWLGKLAGELVQSKIPYDYMDSESTGFQRQRLAFQIKDELFLKLNKLSGNSDLRLFMILAAVLKILVYRYTGVRDIILGVPIYKQRMEGNYSNSVMPLRDQLTGETAFKEFLLQVRQTVNEMGDHCDYPLEQLIYSLNLESTGKGYPLFDMVLLLDNIHEQKYLDDIEVNLVFNFSKREDGIEAVLEYNALLYKEQTVTGIMAHFLFLTEAVLHDPGIRIADLDILSALELRQILFDFNDTRAEYPKTKTIARVFEEQVEKNPRNVAVRFEDRRLTYEELNQKTNQLARELMVKGVAPGSIVGIMVERSLEMIIGIMAILKAGAAYLPIDPEYPQSRIKFAMEDSGAGLLLTQKKWRSRIDFTGEIIELDDVERYRGDCGNVERRSQATDLAYLIYTSGTTGKPKGVMIDNYSVINRIYWMQKQYPIDTGDVILQKTTYTFDVSVWELFWWSFQGAAVSMLAPHGEKDPELIIRAILKDQVTILHFVPSMLSVFLEYLGDEKFSGRLSGLKRVFASGEALTPNLVKKFNDRLNQSYGTTLHNLYGPTEATVDVSYYDCSPGEESGKIPIGKPIDNIQLYIVSHGGKLQPVGVAGELCIGGAGLARGYLNRPELTAEKFIPNHLIALSDRAPQGTPLQHPESGVLLQTSHFKLHTSKMYRTGDLAKWRLDGNIEFLGRIDQQVKIRGFRIELGEIEARLLEYEWIKETVVLAKEDAGGLKYLCAYFVAKRDLTAVEIRAYVSQILPDYMIPSYYVQLEKLPLTPNGKIDRKSLPEPDKKGDSGVAYVAPQTDLEKMVADIWKEVLKHDQVGLNDNFFDLGGHSLTLIQANQLMNQRFKELIGREISVTAMFQYPTINSLLQYLDSKEQADDPLFDEEDRLETINKRSNLVLQQRKKMKVLDND